MTAEDILARFEEPSVAAGVFILGSFERRVTVYSQQVRALDLVKALAETGRLRAGTKLAVIGAGFAGVTAALAAAKHGARVSVFETLEAPMCIQRNSHTRMLDPYGYDWPKPPPDAEPGLPFLRWGRGRAADVVNRLTEEWARAAVAEQIEFHARVKPIVLPEGKHGPWRLEWSAPTPTLRTGSDHRTYLSGADRFALVLVAVGFGTEGKIGREVRPYWDNDNLERSFEEHDEIRTIFVSGCGDGGLVDVQRAILRDPADAIQSVLDTEALAGIRETLLDIEARADEIDDARRDEFLSEAYLNELDTPKELAQAFEAQLRPNRRVILNRNSSAPINRGTSIRNRYVVHELVRRRHVEFIPGEMNFDPNAAPGQVKVLEPGVTTRDFTVNRLVVRHGPRPAIHSVLGPRAAQYTPWKRRGRDPTREPTTWNFDEERLPLFGAVDLFEDAMVNLLGELIRDDDELGRGVYLYTSAPGARTANPGGLALMKWMPPARSIMTANDLQSLRTPAAVFPRDRDRATTLRDLLLATAHDPLGIRQGDRVLIRRCELLPQPDRVDETND